MKANLPRAALAVEHFHAVDAATVQQTIAESHLEYSIDMGKVFIHQGTRYGAPIIIVEQCNQQADELSGIWFDDGAHKS